MPSNCRPPWLETMIPSTPQDTACSTSSGDVIPFNHISIFVCACSHGTISVHSSVSSKAVGPCPVPNSSSPVDTRFGNERSLGSLNWFCISPSLRPRTGTSTDKNKALYPTSTFLLAPDKRFRFRQNSEAERGMGSPSALCSSCNVMFRSLTIHIWIMYGLSAPWALTSSKEVVE